MKYVKLFENFNETPNPLVTKGQKVSVKLTYLQNQPVSVVEAHNDSWTYEGENCFSFLFGGDMMMIARFDEDKKEWYSK